MKNERNPVAKSLKALACLVEYPQSEVGVRELAGVMNLAPSSTHRLLVGLSEAGFVRQNADNGRYELGLEFLRLAHVAGRKSPLHQRALPHMHTLVEACNETALLGIYDPSRHEMLFAASVESSHQLRYAIELNSWCPIYAGASGLAILAFLEEPQIRAVIQRTRLAPLTARSITEPYRLFAELNLIRSRHYAITHGQRLPGAIGLAAPLFGSNGEVVGDVCLTIPEQRFDEDSQPHLIDLLLDCTRKIMKDIGGSPRRELTNI